MNRWKIVGIFVIVGLLALTLKVLYKAGVFTPLDPLPLNAETIPTPPGIEDLDFDPETGTIFLSSHDRRNFQSTGAIYALKSGQLTNLTDKLGLSEFRPHGISFIKTNGHKFLFVISHRDTKNSVLKFIFEGDSLRMINTYSSSEFTTPNDLVAVGENSFFLSNDHGKVGENLKKWADYVALPVGNIVYFDGQRSKMVLDRVAYPNGLAVYDNRLYVASTLGNYIGVYEAEGSNYELKKLKSISVPYAPDNLMVAGSRIYVAAHPKTLKFVAHAKDSTKISPSAIFYLEEDKPKIVYVEDGSKLSGSSTALAVPDPMGDVTLYLGSVYERKILKLSEK